jgi:hypothetical protein
MSANLTPAALRVLRPLARAFGHGWATDPSGPTDAEILALGLAGAVEAWESRLAALDAADPDGGHERLKWRGLIPSRDHRSGSGTVVWEVAPDGAVILEVRRRAEGGLLLLRVEVDPEGRVSGGMKEGAEWPPAWEGYDHSHEEACARQALAALGVPLAWATPVPAPPARPLTVPGPVRRL